MAFTGQQVDAAVTDALRDVKTAKRWSPQERLRHLNGGIVDILQRRPYAGYVTEIVTDQPAAITDLAQNIPLADRYEKTLVYWICWQCLVKDSEDVQNARKAEEFARLYAASL